MSKRKNLIILLLILISVSCVTNQDGLDKNTELKLSYTGNIYLYGERHGDERIINKEFEIWNEYYKNGMRHLFLEISYCTGEYLNIWLKEKNDSILNQIYNDGYGTANHNEYLLAFYRNIKMYCPDTVIHGTDIGHQFNTTGYRFLSYLENNGMESTSRYKIAEENIKQGLYYYRNKRNAVFRENKMADNFLRELKSVDNNDIMGIYGRAHTGLDEMNYTDSVPSMANQLRSFISGEMKSMDLTVLTEPLNIEEICINNKIYETEYFGLENLIGFKDFEYRKFWRIKDAYNDFKNNLITNDVLSYDNYPMKIEGEEVFIVEYKKIDGTTYKSFYISNGEIWEDAPVTVNIIVSDG